MMSIQLDLSALRRNRWYEYVIRFVFGGAITVAAGLIARRWGPEFGGLFLAFPAIFPASATLVEKRAREKKHKAGVAQSTRGRDAAALDARGAALGSIALGFFALTAWRLLPTWNLAASLSASLAIWAAVALLAWRFRKHLRCRTR